MKRHINLLAFTISNLDIREWYTVKYYLCSRKLTTQEVQFPKCLNKWVEIFKIIEKHICIY